MAQVQKSKATLRIMGDDLVPEEITKLLGASPTQAQTKGEKLVSQKTGKERIARTGMWCLSAQKREPADLDGQIDEILSALPSDLSLWREIAKRFHVDLFCGLFLKSDNEGLILSARSLAALGERGIEAGFDIYALFGATYPSKKPEA